MRIFRNISDKKSVINGLLLAILSAGIFLLHETGTGRPPIAQEAFPIAMDFRANQADVPHLYQLVSSAETTLRVNNSQFLVLKTLSRKIQNLVSLSIKKSKEKLPVSQIDKTQHFRSRSLTSEDPFHSFS